MVTPQTKYAPDSCHIGGDLNESFQLSDSSGAVEAGLATKSFLSLVMNATSQIAATSGSAINWMNDHTTFHTIFSIIGGGFSAPMPSGFSPMSSGLSRIRNPTSGNASIRTSAPSTSQATRQCVQMMREAANGVSISPPRDVPAVQRLRTTPRRRTNHLARTA